MAGSKGEGRAYGGVPVFPVVNAIADAEFILHTSLAHGLMQTYVEIEEKIVVAAVDKPFHGAELGEGGFRGILYKAEGVVRA